MPMTPVGKVDYRKLEEEITPRDYWSWTSLCNFSDTELSRKGELFVWKKPQNTDTAMAAIFWILSVDNFYFPFYHRDNSCAAQVQSFQKEGISMKNKKFASFLAAAAALVLLAMPAFAADEQTELPAAEAADW